MIQEKVEYYFSHFPQLRILFFFDEGGEYSEEVNPSYLNDQMSEVIQEDDINKAVIATISLNRDDIEKMLYPPTEIIKGELKWK